MSIGKPFMKGTSPALTPNPMNRKMKGKARSAAGYSRGPKSAEPVSLKRLAEAHEKKSRTYIGHYKVEKPAFLFSSEE